MMLKTSSNKLNPAFNLFSFTIKNNFKLVLLFIFGSALICPGFVLIKISEHYKVDSFRETFNLQTILPYLVYALNIISVVICLIFLFLGFMFLYSRKSSDVFHAIPLTRTELLLSRYFSAVILSIIPVTVSYFSLFVMTFTPMVNGNPLSVFYAFILNIFILLMISSFTMIFIVCAGTGFDLMISFFGINISIPIMYAMFTSICGYMLNGYSYSSTESLIRISPFVYCGYHLSVFTNYNITRFTSDTMFFIIKMIIFTVIFLLGSVLLYNRRKSEKSGEAYAYSFMYTISAFIITLIGAYCVGMIFSPYSCTNALFWFFAVCGSLLASIAFGAVSSRGFKTIKRSLAISAVSVIFLVALTMILSTEGLGYSKRIPSSEKNIESTEVSIWSDTTTFKGGSLGYKLHKEIVENLDKTTGPSSRLYSDNTIIVNIKHILKSGREYYREYKIDSDFFNQTLLEIYRSDEKIDGIIKNLTKKKYDYSMCFSSKYGVNGVRIDNSNHYVTKTLTKTELLTLMNAYKKDIKKATIDSFRQKQNCEVYNINTNIEKSDDYSDYINSEIVVENHFTETLSVIEQLGIDKVGESYDSFEFK